MSTEQPAVGEYEAQQDAYRWPHRNPSTPSPGDTVHYRAYGTPRGEFPAACRAALVTGTGAWVMVPNSEVPGLAVPPVDGDRRVIEQVYHEDAISATVHNPSGEYRGILVHDQSSDPRGGTWHYPGAHCRPGGTR